MTEGNKQWLTMMALSWITAGVVFGDITNYF